MKKILLLSTCLLCLSTVVYAKDSPPAINVEQETATALSEYKAQHYGKALQALQLATEQTHKLRAKTLVVFLPVAPKDWNTSKPIGIDIGGRGTSVHKVYDSRGEIIRLYIEADQKVDDLRKSKSPLVGKTQKLLGYDYVFKSHDPLKKDGKNTAMLYLSPTLAIRINGTKLTDAQAQGFMGLINIPKLLAEVEKG